MDWLNKFLKPKQFAGIDYHIQPDGNINLYITCLKRTQNKVEIVFTDQIVSNVEELKKIVDIKWPITLTINGKGIIHKKIESDVIGPESNDLNRILPGAKLLDFYIQLFQNLKNNKKDKYVSIIRKDLLNKIIEDFNKAGYLIEECLLGPFHIVNLKSIIKSDNNDFIKVGKSILQFENEFFVNVGFDSNLENGKEGYFNIGEYKVKEMFLISFCSAFANLSENKPIIEFDILKVRRSKEEIFQKQIFLFFGWASLTFFFTLLLINFLLFTYFREKNLNLSYNMDSIEKVNDANNKLLSEYKLKRDFLIGNNLMESSRISYYADRIACSIPDKINLTGIEIFPVIKNNMKDSEGYEFQRKRILISGEVLNSAYLNNWMKEVKAFDWTKQVNLINYNQANLKENGRFNIELIVN